jgi:NTP pyrophosphatase (non-canonical NTP hydrolase)
MRDLELLQKELHNWRTHNFPSAGATQQLLGVMEEVGELSHAHLKAEQGIRGDAVVHEGDAMDAVGDILIYLAGYCSYQGWSMMQIFDEVAQQVMRRDWITYPDTGFPPIKSIPDPLY